MTLTEQWQHDNYLQLYFIDFGIEHDIQLKVFGTMRQVPLVPLPHLSSNIFSLRVNALLICSCRLLNSTFLTWPCVKFSCSRKYQYILPMSVVTSKINAPTWIFKCVHAFLSANCPANWTKEAQLSCTRVFWTL